MNEATRAAQQALHPATVRLPATFSYPLGGILGRTAIGLALLAAGGAMVWHSGILWIVGGALLVVLGGVATSSNLSALLDPERRKIVLDEEGIEIRYGLSRRYYRFLDYSDYRITRLGLRRFLAALPMDVERSLGKQAERVRVTMHDQPAFLTPMPLLGKGAPATLLEWQATLNELRRAAIAAAGLTEELDRANEEETAEEARRAAVWRAREQAGAKASRLSRRRYVRGRFILALVFVLLLLGPVGFATAVKQGRIAVCGSAGGAGCLSIDPMLQQMAMIGGPLLAVLVFALGNARLTVRRAHDLDLDLPYWKAALDLLSRNSALRHRLGREVGTAGTNRFGPMPPE
ncbi:hypothetical protein [Dongia deserti]|uniref:hypothetical protein n=1 Tax=Dongia deserti TaxID=2268030 RepID=UPI000E649B7A|nr:hypothetical protein [Dongia deserti]